MINNVPHDTSFIYVTSDRADSKLKIKINTAFKNEWSSIIVS